MSESSFWMLPSERCARRDFSVLSLQLLLVMIKHSGWGSSRSEARWVHTTWAIFSAEDDGCLATACNGHWTGALSEAQAPSRPRCVAPQHGRIHKRRGQPRVSISSSSLPRLLPPSPSLSFIFSSFSFKAGPSVPSSQLVYPSVVATSSFLHRPLSLHIHDNPRSLSICSSVLVLLRFWQASSSPSLHQSWLMLLLSTAMPLSAVVLLVAWSPCP